MHKKSYSEKIEILLTHYKFSTKLAEALRVHRMSIQNWRKDSQNISKENRFNIDMLFAQHYIVPRLSKSIVQERVNRLSKENHKPFITNIDIILEVSRKNAFGSLEVEIDDASEVLFYRVLDNDFIEKDMNKRKFLEMSNLAFLTNQMMTDTIEGYIETIDSRLIKKWHFGLMSGIRSDAGHYSTKMRIIPDTHIALTLPEDIPEEIEYWVSRYTDVNTIFDIASAHEHFELIHPFGDGNGRIGRLIMAQQFISNGMLPPLIDGQNKALYYITLEEAQTKGNILPLVYFLIEAVDRMKEKLGIERYFKDAK